MLVELSIIPVGNDPHMSTELADVLRLIDESGLPYELTPTATCLEGDWADIMPVIRLCHERVRRRCPHVITTITIEDEDGAQNKLTANIDSVEQKVGRRLSRERSRRTSSR